MPPNKKGNSNHTINPNKMKYSAYTIEENGSQMIYRFYSSEKDAKEDGHQLRKESGDLEKECPNGLPSNWEWMG